MNQNIQNKIKDKIQEDISPTRNLSGIHLKIVFGIATSFDFVSTLVCITFSILVKFWNV